MSKSLCEFCGHYVKDIEEKCPNCGAPNRNHLKVSSNMPKTIDELNRWYKSSNLPSEKITLFYIGKDLDEPYVLGIYEKDNIFIVYKNSDTGIRDILYEGDEEWYAVSIYYNKLQQEVKYLKISASRLVSDTASAFKFFVLLMVTPFLVLVVIGALVLIFIFFTQFYPAFVL